MQNVGRSTYLSDGNKFDYAVRNCRTDKSGVFLLAMPNQVMKDHDAGTKLGGSEAGM